MTSRVLKYASIALFVMYLAVSVSHRVIHLDILIVVGLVSAALYSAGKYLSLDKHEVITVENKHKTNRH